MRFRNVHGFSMLALATAAFAADLPDRYWPEFPAPTKVLVSESHNRVSFAEGMLLNTVSGLVSRHARTQGSGEMVWIGLSDAPSYDEWRRRWIAHHGLEFEPGEHGVWDLVDRYRDRGIIKGYLLFRQDRTERRLYAGTSTDSSANVATALCAVLGGVAVEESIEAEAQAHGLECLLDVRGKDEAWLWAEYGPRFPRTCLALQDPKSFVMRDAIVAAGAMVVSGTGPLYEGLLAALEPASPVFGWGIGLEDAITGPSSRYAAFQTATNWCVNLPLLSAGRTGLDYPFEPLPQPESDLEDGPNARYVAFVMTDGDNVQWLMLNFCKGLEARQFWACPDRGQIPFGWTIPPMHLLQMCPYTLDYLRETATARDDFIMLGGGYYYPDWFGAARPEQGLLALHARRMAKYLGHAGVSKLLVNVQDWDCDAAMEAYQTYAREIPTLEGIFAIQYAPYAAGRGRIRWVRGGARPVPVVTPRHAIWNHRREGVDDGTPGKVAALLNRWAEGPLRAREDRFAWVIVHCWSWFRHAEAGALWADEEVEQKPYDCEDIARGYRPALWCAERLSPRIRVVTPAELLRRLRAGRSP